MESGIKISIIEGDPIYTNIVEARLIKIGYTVVSTFSSGQEAYKKLAGALPHILIIAINIPGEIDGLNPELEKAGRVADFLELGELMAMDALNRDESCGGHFREEYQTPEGEALRNDKDFMYVSAWEFKGRTVKADQRDKGVKVFTYIPLYGWKDGRKEVTGKRFKTATVYHVSQTE
jgi:CheY-like chemotaxis protein